MQTIPGPIGPKMVTLIVCGHQIAELTNSFVVAAPRSKVPRGWRPGSLCDGLRHQKVYVPPEEWRRIVETPRKVNVTINVGGVLARGVAGLVLPWRYRRSRRCPKDWRVASVLETGASVRIPPDDYVCIVNSNRNGSAGEVWQEALQAHVSFLTRLEMRKLLERRISGLRDCYLPKPMVDGGLFNRVPRAHDWREFIVNAEGEVSCESLARAGLLEKIGIAYPYPTRISLSPWEMETCVASVFPAKLLDDNDLAWAEELEREVEKATRPYR